MGILPGHKIPTLASLPNVRRKQSSKSKKEKKIRSNYQKKKKIQANHQQKDYQQPNQHYQQMNPKTDCKSYPKTEMTISMEERIFF